MQKHQGCPVARERLPANSYVSRSLGTPRLVSLERLTTFLDLGRGSRQSGKAEALHGTSISETTHYRTRSRAAGKVIFRGSTRLISQLASTSVGGGERLTGAEAAEAMVRL